jgi:hypothetical protein
MLSMGPTLSIFNLRSRQRGVAVWKLLVGLGVGAVAAAFFLTSDHALSPEVRQESSNLVRLSEGLQQSYPGKDYAALTVADAVAKQAIPGTMFRGGQEPIRSAWGTAISFKPHTVLKPADGFVIVYQGVPAEACQQLARVLAERVYELKVSGKTVLAPDGFDPVAAGQHCERSEGATMEFFFHPELIPQTGVLR